MDNFLILTQRLLILEREKRQLVTSHMHPSQGSNLQAFGAEMSHQARNPMKIFIFAVFTARHVPEFVAVQN